MNAPAILTDKFLAAECRKSYWVFFQEFWAETAQETLKTAWYMRELCNELQYVSERVFRDEPKDHDVVWNCPPGTTKSTITSILWNCWLWSRMPFCRVISGSYAESLALDHSRKSRDVITGKLYARLFPEIELSPDQNSKGHFVNTKGGFRIATGTGGAIMGRHGHALIVDDPVDPKEAASKVMLADADYWMRETLSRRKTDLMVSVTVLIQQRLAEGDPTGEMLSRKGKVKHFCVPCDNTWEIKPKEWAAYYETNPEGLLDPVRLPRAALVDALADLLEIGYAGQYGQKPVPRGGATFDVEQLRYEDHAPRKWRQGRAPVRYWDKASTKGGGAYTVGVLGGLDTEDNFWVLDVVRFQKNSGAREKEILATGYRDGKQVRIAQEQEPAGSGKESADNSRAALALKGFRTIVDRPTGDKELRADPFSVYVNTGRVILLRRPWNDDYKRELEMFPRGKFKDQVDATSGLFGVLGKRRIRVGAVA